MSLILSGSDGLSDVDGSASTPAIRGTDANTGIFFPAADTIAFAEGGTEVLRVDSSGNLQLRSAGTSILNSSGNRILQQTGSVIQVVSAGTTTGVTVSNQTETDTGVTATITPTSSSNKILVLVTMMGVFKSSGNADNRVHLLLKRGTTTINNVGAVFATGTALNQRGGISISKLDSPATTNATTYKVTFYNDENAAEVSVQRDSNSGESTITLMEIVA